MKSPKQRKSSVLAFRLRPEEREKLNNERQKVVGVRSANQFARKVVVDYLSGRLIYTNPDDALFDRTVINEDE